MAKRKDPVHFDRPRDEEGHFLPMELWTKKEGREFERLKREGLFINPFKEIKVKGKKRAKPLYIHPQGKEGRFLPKSEWTASEKRLAKRAEEEGLTIAHQLPRNAKGQFVSPTGKPKKKKAKGSAVVPSGVDYQMAIHPHDGGTVHQGNVTVVYPPYPPPLSPPSSTPLVQYVPMPMQPQPQMVQQLETSRRVERELDELEDEPRNHQLELFESEGMLYERDTETGEITACVGVSQIRDELKKEHLRTRDVFSKLCGPCVPKGDEDVLENPRLRHPMYYVKRAFGDKVGDALGFMRENPLVALVAVGAFFVVGYALYKAFQAYRLRFFASQGVDIVNGVIYFPGAEPYRITDDDKLWLARSIWGEVNRNPDNWSRPDVQQGGSAVLWAFANHYITVGAKRNLYSSLGSFVQGYSQPINPRWDDPNDALCLRTPAMCTASRIAFRRSLRSKRWDQFPEALQNLVLNFVAGRVQNTVGTRTDFRAAGTGYAPADPINVAGNVFGTAPNARQRPSQQVA